MSSRETLACGEHTPLSWSQCCYPLVLSSVSFLLRKRRNAFSRAAQVIKRIAALPFEPGFSPVLRQPLCSLVISPRENPVATIIIPQLFPLCVWFLQCFLEPMINTTLD
ncbi:hypothetical protein K443DRAFT_387359 [Laccaria amethystina LaAM-08-1]|uniref:Uncharacterized protein n=1 Tax=Laccaria amethystina LaAM-08-1 TaxID=1095629 RepID=A0A0C9XWR3_9AGAR|nr:hypothetical protein K443DRAFT_387359 [Laccaria amethystina LaAM-08-1]